MRYPQETKYFSEDAAVFADYQSNPRFKTVDLMRFFSTSREELRATGLAMLDKFTSAANATQIEADIACDFVDNPRAGVRGVYPGRWRLISNKQAQDPTDPSKQGILQHLRLYRLTTLLDTATPAAIDFTMARVVAGDSSLGNTTRVDDAYTYSANPAKLITLEWAAIHPSKVADVIAEFSARLLPTLTFVVDGQSFTGLAYLFALVKDEETDKDGSKTVQFVIGRPEYVLKYRGQVWSLAPFTGFLVWDIPKDAAQTLLDNVLAHHGQGVTALPEYDKGAHTVSIRFKIRDSLGGYGYDFFGGGTCMQTETLEFYTGYTKENLAVLLNSLAGQVSSGVWYTLTVTEDRDDGLFDALVTKHVAVEVYQTPQVSKLAATSQETTQRGFNLKSSGVLPMAGFTAGRIQQRTIQKNPNCTEDVTLVYDDSIYRTFDAVTEDSTLVNARTRSILNSLVKTDATLAYQGAIYRADNTLAPDGTYQGKLIYEVSKPIVSTKQSEDSTLNSTHVTLYANSRAPLEAPDGIQGAIYRVSHALQPINPDGTYHGQVIYEVSKPVSVTAQTGDDFTKNEHTTMYANSRSKIEASGGTQGSLYRAGNTIQVDGTYHGQLVYEYSKAVMVVATTGDSFTSHDQTAVYLNSRSMIEAPGGTQGSLYKSGNTINPDGTYHGQLVYEYSKAVMAVATTGDSFTSHDQTAVYLNSRSMIETPGGAQGSLYKSGNTINPDGTYHGQLVYEYSKEVQVSRQSGDSVTSTEQAALYVNSRTPVSAPAGSQGVIYKAGMTMNPDGTYHGELQYAYSKRVQFSLAAEDAGLHHIDQQKYVANRVPVGASASVQGGIYRSAFAMAQDGTYHGETSYQGSKAADVYVNWQTLNGGAGAYFFRNQLALPASTIAALTQCTRNRVSVRTNDDLTYDASIEIEPVEYHWWSGQAAQSATIVSGQTRVSIDWNGDGTSWRTVTTTYTLYYRTTEADANTAASGGGPGTKVWATGVQWKALKVTSVAYSAWTVAASYTWS